MKVGFISVSVCTPETCYPELHPSEGTRPTINLFKFVFVGFVLLTSFVNI